MSEQCVQQCDDCGAVVEGADLQEFSDAYLAHVRSRHPDWPFPDIAIRNVAEATQRLTGPTTRLDTIGQIVIHSVSEDRIEDWLSFFDHDGFAGNPVDAVCYCSSPHVFPAGQDGGAEMRSWRQNRELMIDLLRSGRVFGYLAYVDDRPAGWVNASKRAECSQLRWHNSGQVPDSDVISVACFVIAPPYRRHGLARALLQRILDDAPARGAAWVEAYPLKSPTESDAGNNRGHRSLFTDYGFELIEERDQYCIMRCHVGPGREDSNS